MSKLSKTFRESQGPPPTRRLIIMAVAGVLLIGVMAAVPFVLTPPEEPDDNADNDTRAKGTDAPPRGAVKATVADGDLDAPQTPTPVITLDNTVFATVLDGGPIRPEERQAYDELLDRARALGKHTSEANALVVAPTDLLATPAGYRAQFVRLWGRLHEVVPHTDDNGSTGVWACTLAVGPTNTVRAIVLEDPAEAKLAPGSDARIDGYFLKVGASLTRDGAAALEPIVVGARLCDDNDLLARVVDRKRMQKDEYDIYYRMTALAWQRRDAGDETPPTVTQAQLLAEPEKYRAKRVRIEGGLIEVKTRQFDPDRTGTGRPRNYYECWLSAGRHGFVLVLTYRHPREDGIKPGRDRVRADGYFFKNWAFGPGNSQRVAPLLMGSRLEKRNVEVTDPLTPLITGVMLTLAVVIVVLWVWLKRGKARADALRRRISIENTEDLELPEPRSLPRDAHHDDRE